MAYDVEAFDVFGAKWSKKSPYRVTGRYPTRQQAEKAMSSFQNRLQKANKKADSDLRPEAYGTVAIPKLRIKKR